MTEDNKKQEGSCCKSGCGCGCGAAKKFICGLLIGAFVFAAGMWFAKSQCSYKDGMKMCPISGQPLTK